NRMRRFIIARGSALGRFGNNPRGGRNQYAEATSAARGTFNVNSSSVRLDYVPHEAQPQPVPMDLRSESIAAPIKRLEYSRELRRFDTKAAVFDRYPHNMTSRGVLIAGSDSNTATIASVLDRVAYQILDRAAQRRGVCSDQRQGRVDMLVEYKVVLSDDRIRSGDCVVYYICDGRRLEVVSSPAGLYPRELQRLLNHLAEPPAFVFNELAISAYLVPFIDYAIGKVLRRRPYDRKRRTQFVRHARHKLDLLLC